MKPLSQQKATAGFLFVGQNVCVRGGIKIHGYYGHFQVKAAQFEAFCQLFGHIRQLHMGI